MMKTRVSRNKRQSEQGVVLVVLLVILLIVSVMGLSSVRGSTTAEKIVGNVRDRNKAFQAAEAAVQSCLEQVNAGTYPSARIMLPSDSEHTPNWEVAANWESSSAATVEVTLPGPGLSKLPRCMVESLGAGSFRVTGRAVGGSPDTEVVLQANYTTE